MRRNTLSSKIVIRFSDFLRAKLRKPLGRLVSFRKIRTDRKLIAVGDQITLNLIHAGITPHLAVCDFRIKRREVSGEVKQLVSHSFKIAGRYDNPPGTLSLQLLKDAKKLIREGGLVAIRGEEDLTAIAFILAGSKNHLVLYGQPGEGVVEVKPENAKVKRKIKRILAAALAHKMK